MVSVEYHKGPEVKYFIDRYTVNAGYLSLSGSSIDPSQDLTEIISVLFFHIDSPTVVHTVIDIGGEWVITESSKCYPLKCCGVSIPVCCYFFCALLTPASC